MYQNIQDILNVLWYDEDLLRLLHYSPEDIRTDTLDPLDPSLPNLLDKDELELWDIRNDVIMLTPKDDDLIENQKCRIFVYLGDRYSDRGNYQIANQNVIFDVICHADYENGDMRSARIGDRLNELFALERVTGIGKMDFVKTRIITRVPSQYVAYQFVYEFSGMKK